MFEAHTLFFSILENLSRKKMQNLFNKLWIVRLIQNFIIKCNIYALTNDLKY